MADLQITCNGQPIDQKEIKWNDANNDNKPQLKEVSYKGKPASKEIFDCYIGLVKLVGTRPVKKSETSARLSNIIYNDDEKYPLDNDARELISKNKIVRAADKVTVTVDRFSLTTYISIEVIKGDRVWLAKVPLKDEDYDNDLYLANAALRNLENQVRSAK